MALNVWVTFVRKVDANNFKKSPNLVTLLRCFVLVVCLFICLPLSLLVLHLTDSRCCLHCISLFTSKICLFVATFKSREFRGFSKSFLFSTLINVPIYLSIYVSTVGLGEGNHLTVIKWNRTHWTIAKNFSRLTSLLLLLLTCLL